MERIFQPVRRFISRGLSFPTLPTLSRFSSTEDANAPLPSAGKRQREDDSDEEGDGGPKKRAKMELDSPTPASAPAIASASASEDMTPVEEIRPKVEELSLAATPPPSSSPVKSAQSTPGTRTKYQRALRGTRKSEPATTPSKPRLGPKRQCALLVGFCGTGYSGMQM